MEDLDEPADILPEKLAKLVELVQQCCSHQHLSITPLGDFRIRVSHDRGSLFLTLNDRSTVVIWAETIVKHLQPHKLATENSWTLTPNSNSPEPESA